MKNMLRHIRENKKTYLISVAIPLAVGGLSALVTRQGMKHYNASVVQPPLSPPQWLFPVVWTALYTLMGIGSGRVYLEPQSRARSAGLNLYAAQLIVNFFWSLIFFNAGAYGLAAIWLVLLLILAALMAWYFGKAEKWAGLLQIPYLLWLSFALYLNLGVWALN